MVILGSEITTRDASATETQMAMADTVVFLTTAELAECNCPEFCERDHDVD